MSSKPLRAYPQSIEAERALLCSLFLDNSRMSEVIEVVDKEDFYDERNAILFGVMKDLYLENVPIDFITVKNALEEKGLLESVGVSYLTGIVDFLPAPANAKYYAEIIYRKSVLRSLIHISSEIAEMCYEDPESLEEVIDAAEKKIFEISSRKKTSYISVSDMTDDTLNYIDALRKRQTVLTGVPTGFNDLDRMTGGFQKGDLIIVAGRPGMGKTAFVVSLAINAATQYSKSIGIFSLEMTAQQLVLRMIASLSNVGVFNLRTGMLDHSQYKAIGRALDKLKNVRIYIDDTSMMRVSDIRSKARKLKMEKGVDLIIIDYLQLMHGRASSNLANRVQEVSEISRSLKVLAKELDVPIIALSQLNRGVEARDNKRPMVADLRESGSIEQDADVILLIYRDEVYNKNTSERGIAEVIIGKQRNGPQGTVKLQFEERIATFRNLSNITDEAEITERYYTSDPQ